MKPCIYCGEQIQDTARKCSHCQSFQNPSDAPRQSFDLATIVISFVGIVATLGTLAAGVFGYFGFRTIGDVNDRTKEINQKSTDLLLSTELKIRNIDTEIQSFKKTVGELKQQAGDVKKQLNGVAVSDLYDKFQQVFEVIHIDYAYNFSLQIGTLAKIASDAEALQPTPDTSAEYIANMKLLSQAVSQYRDALKDNDKDEWLSLANFLQKAANDSLEANRILVGCYSHLYDIARRASKNSEALDYLSRQKQAGLRALKSAQKLSRSSIIVKVNYGATLLQGGDTLEMKKGYELLLEARKDAPQIAAIWYNIATYFAKINQFDESLKNLEQAKSLGDFATCNDITQWERDPDFDSLRATGVPDYKDRIERLRQIGGAKC